MISNREVNSFFLLPIKLLTLVCSLAIALLGAGVLYVWHNPTIHLQGYNTIILMGYNTAICMVLSSLALVCIHRHLKWPLRSIAVAILIITCMTLIELIFGFSLNINHWFEFPLSTPPDNGGFMSTTTASCFTLLAISFLLISVNKNQGETSIPVIILLLNLLSLVISSVAILGYSMSLKPAYVWMGISMAPHTAIGLSLIAITLTAYILPTAISTFNRMKFLNRLISGFFMMTLLVGAIGIIANNQITQVSLLTHELYDNPLQVNNAAMRIKADLYRINRLLKNAAITHDLTLTETIASTIEQTEPGIEKDLRLIETLDSEQISQAQQLGKDFNDWKIIIFDSCRTLDKRDFDSYDQRILFDGQEQLAKLEATINAISQHAQEKIGQLNMRATNTEHQARQLVILFVVTFIFVGLAIALLITRSLSAQLQSLREIMLSIATEKPDVNIPYLDHPEEIGDMARALSFFSKVFTEKRLLEDRLLQMLEGMPIGVIMTNQSGTIEIANKMVENIFGYEQEQLLNTAVENLIPKRFAENHHHYRDQYYQAPTPRNMGAGRELFGLRKDGSEVPLEIALTPITTAEGIKILASIVDITERKQANKALTESHQRMEMTAKVNGIGIWEYDLDTGKLFWDDSMFAIYGRNSDLFSGDFNAWRQCVHPDDLEQTLEKLDKAIVTASPFVAKFRIIKPDGSISHIHAKAKVERVSHNKLRMLGTNIDITREEEAIQKLAEIEGLRASIVEFSEDAIISKTPEGIVTSWNAGATNIFGYTAEEAIGKSIKDLVFPEELIYQEDLFLENIRAGQAIKHFETIRRCKDGRVINVSITLSPIKDSKGKIVGVSAIKRDITQTKLTAQILAQRQQELERSNHELARSNRELETFAYVASHDLKSPLRGVAQLSSWIEEDIAEHKFDEVINHTSLLRNRIQRMEKLLDDLLIFYRAGKNEGNITNINIKEIICDIFEIQNNKQGIKLETPSTMPVINTLRTPFEQIIRNLLSNAIKHHDKPEGFIRVDAHQLNDDWYEFSVTDDGPGIPPAFHERIFGMFQTLKPRDELEGSGMGLALIKKLVENYGGKISVASQGRGCTFTFTWPVNIKRINNHD